MIKPNEHDKISFGCEDEESCVTLATKHLTVFLSDSKTNVSHTHPFRRPPFIYVNIAELIPICRFLQSPLDYTGCANDGIFKTAEEPQHPFCNIQISFLCPFKYLIICLLLRLISADIL